MSWLPCHHDWKLAFDCGLGLRVHWFGRYGGFPEWEVPKTRLAADMIEFWFIEKSSCWIELNGRNWKLKEGDLFIVLGGDEFMCGHDPNEPHVSLSVALALQRGSETNALLHRRFERRYVLKRPNEYRVEFDKVVGAFAGISPHRDLEIMSALLHWLAYVLKILNPPFDNTYARDRSAVDRILAAETWASSQLKETITLNEWAKAVGLNEVYFGRVFKRETGLTPIQWLNQRRLQQACQLLSSTQKSVSTISEECGFLNQFYFSRVFRKWFHESPLQYRSSHRHH